MPTTERAVPNQTVPAPPTTSRNTNADHQPASNSATTAPTRGVGTVPVVKTTNRTKSPSSVRRWSNDNQGFIGLAGVAVALAGVALNSAPEAAPEPSVIVVEQTQLLVVCEPKPLEELVDLHRRRAYPPDVVLEVGREP